jgi:hypothetical protein
MRSTIVSVFLIAGSAGLASAASLDIIQHVHKACELLGSAHDDRAQSELIRSDLYDSIVRPISRALPDASGTSSQAFPPKVFRATPRDIGRTTADKFNDVITRALKSIIELGQGEIDRSVDENAARKIQERFLDTTTELSFARKIVFDAYPTLFTKAFDTIPDQPRTAERDASFRKLSPPLGSVKLSDAALALIQAFMQELRRVPGGEWVVTIGWARDQKFKRPADREWTNEGAGWFLGSYRKVELPPDVIDTVRGVEIVFTADDPSALAGKTIDATEKKLFIRD